MEEQESGKKTTISKSKQSVKKKEINTTRKTKKSKMEKKHKPIKQKKQKELTTKKRKYVRREPYIKRPPKPKPPPKKRGRKRGRKKKDEEYMMKPEDFIDYAIRNFPKMKFERIREKFIEGVKTRNKIYDDRYTFDRHLYDNKYYWKDKYEALFNLDGQFVAHIVNIEGVNRVFFLEDEKRNTMSYDDVMKSRIDIMTL